MSSLPRIKAIHDISLPIENGMIVYPNNTAPEFSFVRKIPEGNSTLSKILLGSHTGTHVDAPLHTNPEGIPLDGVPLSNFVGHARVLGCTSVPFGSGITEKELAGTPVKKGDIVLLKTRNSARGFRPFHDDFIHLELSGARFLRTKEVAAVGIDSLGIQKRGSGNVLVHRELLDHGITIFEGLDLREINPGEYFFCGLPLKVVGAEAAPCRAVLIELE